MIYIITILIGLIIMSLTILHRRRLQQSVNIVPNTFIGGVASTIPDAQSLATKLEILKSNISYFKIIGSDVEAVIDVSYAIPGYCFQSTSITKYEDTGEKITGIGNYAFDNCLSFSRLYSNSNITTMGNYIIGRTPNTVVVELPNISNMNYGSALPFAYATASKIDIRSCLQLGTSTGNNQFFFDINAGCEIIVPISLQTANGGAEEGDIAYARSKGCTITYV